MSFSKKDLGHELGHRFFATELPPRVQRFDFIESLLMRNMVDVVEAVFGYVGIESSRDCLLVCRLWYEFLTLHIYKR